MKQYRCNVCEQTFTPQVVRQGKPPHLCANCGTTRWAVPKIPPELPLAPAATWPERRAAWRFFRRVAWAGPDECWLWQGTLRENGYGSFANQKAHRIAYEWCVGSIPPGLTLDHLCRVKHCVNPAHLEPVTQRENGMRCPESPSTINAHKTHCPRGHPLVEGNLVATALKHGKRSCKICQGEAIKRWRRANPEKIAARKVRYYQRHRERLLQQ